MLIGAPLLVLAIFLHARILGRLAFALVFTRDVLKRKKKKKPKNDNSGSNASADAPRPPVPIRQSEVPPLSTPDGELDAYNVLVSDDPPAPRKRVKAEVVSDDDPLAGAPRKTTKPSRSLDRSRTWTDEDDDTTPYGLNPSEPKDEERLPEAVLKASAEELSLLNRSGTAKRPKRVWTAELFVCFGQPATISAMTILCLIGLAAGAMVRVARQFKPVLSE